MVKEGMLLSHTVESLTITLPLIWKGTPVEPTAQLLGGKGRAEFL